MNNQAFYEDFFLSYLYKVKEYDTERMEPLFQSVDPQLVNNVISNRNNSTSHIMKGLMSYDAAAHKLYITLEGERYIENKYSERRS